MVWPSGKCSKLDRALVSTEWIQEARWELIGLYRKFSDHVVIILWKGVKDWRPKPFKVFNHWLEKVEFKAALMNHWNSFSGSNLHFKFNMLRQYIKECNDLDERNCHKQIAILEEK